MWDGTKTTKVYHGTTSAYVDSIINKINLSECEDKTDFGKGFYVTSSYEQAKIWGNGKAPQHTIDFGREIKGIVIEYEINLDIISILNIHQYNELNAEWIEAILHGRAGNKHTFDVVYGPLADGRDIVAKVKKVENGTLNKNQFFKKIKKYDFPEKNQISFHTDKALLALDLVKIHYT